jgi:branched-chain amino acid transport system substrate-binding protein
MPLVADVLEQALGKPPTAVGQHQLVVAKGAAHLPLPAVPADNGTARAERGPAADPPAGPSDNPAAAGTARDTRTSGGKHRSRARSYRDVRGGRVPRWTSLRPRHKLIAAAVTLVLVAVATVTLTSLLASSTAGQATAGCGYKIAYLGSPTGFMATPASSRYGVELAVEEYRTRNPGCQVELVAPGMDDPPSDTVIEANAKRVVSDPKILGVVSPLHLSETQVAQPIFDLAGVATISPTLTTPNHARYGAFHRTVGTSFDDITAGLYQLTHDLNARNVFVVADNSPDSVDGAKYAQSWLGDTRAGTAFIEKGTDQSALVDRIATSKADSVYYTGYNVFSSFASFVAQLRSTMPTITIAGWQFTYAAAADQSPNNVHITCTCVPRSQLTRDFTDRFTRRYHVAPTWYTAEAFDAANILLSGLAAGRHTRSTMLDWVNLYDGNGVSGHIKFSPNGDLAAPRTWAMKYVDGALVVDGPIIATQLSAR